MKPTTLAVWSFLALTLWALTTVVPGCSTSSSSSTGSQAQGAGVCADKCLKECASDNECDTSKGELCCDYGDGKACSDAKDCPRFCHADKDCKTADGEACVRTTLASTESVCTDPGKGLHLCKSDSNCQSDEVCCGIYAEPLCLKADRCPQSCSRSSDCSTDLGEVCCTTLKTIDSSLAADGLCIDPSTTTCPTACAKSTDCDTKHGEICCNGLCATSCQQACQTSSDCDGQVCCRSSAERSPWVQEAPDPGYDVAKAPASSGGTGGGANGGSSNGGSSNGGGANGGTSGSSTAACERCSAALAAGDVLGTNLCKGTSTSLFEALASCTCTDACSNDCSNFCTTGKRDATCDACVVGSCGPEFAACSGDK